MSKKHYIVIAAILESLTGLTDTKVGATEVALSLSDYFARENAAFNRERFLSACNVKP